MKKWMKWGLAGAGLLVGGVLAFGVLTASAQVPGRGGGQRDPGHYQELLAQQLGISVEQLRTANQAAFNKLIDEAVAAGRLTPEQGAKAKEAGPGAALKHRVQRHGRIRAAIGNVVEAAADTIGISQDKVKSELQSGKSLAEIAEDNGVSRDKLKAGIVTEIKAQLDTAVTNGRLTRAQADKIIAGLSDRIDKAIDHEGGGRPGPRRP